MEKISLREKTGSKEKGLKAEYYRSYNFSGNPYKTEIDEELRIFGILDQDVFGSVLWTGEFIAHKDGPVSYTHLTLPTKP